ncbi:hypothetical protein GQX73_g619 [Xylaria multiplex]|uniref:Uncharacterized protein n=1 Tax=Xylaria multiplex TaxID=323545 RepID=A0A7C8J834_9PEZI|nr:hypothetical protein GQX73_g619 [Xylaria multiplex]
MEDGPRAGSIFELLTHRNPHVILSPESGTNTHNQSYFWPRKIKKWEEFHFENLDKIYGGLLMNVARNPRDNLPHYPFILGKDCRISDEPTTTNLISKWNDTVVSAALDAVKGELNPSIWIQKASKPKQSTNTPNSGSKGKKKDDVKISLRPDSGAYSVHEENPENGEERFPKDYKYAGSWSSLKVRNGQHVDIDTGEWKPGFVQRNDNMPIRQAYTYSVLFQCRYGCILTTEEAFIFRIGPIEQNSESAEGGSSINLNPQQIVRTKGLMEYVSIPWTHGTENNTDNYNKLTVNLALWVLHILAGNHHRILKKYPELSAEKLASPIIKSENLKQESGRKRLKEPEGPWPRNPYRQKRSKTDASQDDIYLSFSGGLPLGVEPSVDDSATERNSSHDDKDDVDSEAELQVPRILRPRHYKPGRYKC